MKAEIINDAIEVQRLGTRRWSTTPKILEPPTAAHGVPVKCAACAGKGVIDVFYKNALQMHDDQQNTSTDCCFSPLMCCWMSCCFCSDCCPCCCCGGECCCFGSLHLEQCIRGELIPGRKSSCRGCFGEGWVRYDGHAKALRSGPLAAGSVKYYVACPGRKSSFRCNACEEPIPFGRGGELLHRASDDAALCLTCAEVAPAAERALCERISVYEHVRRSAKLKDLLRLFHELVRRCQLERRQTHVMCVACALTPD